MTTVSSRGLSDSGGSQAVCVGGALVALGRAVSRRVEEVTAKKGLTADLWYVLDEVTRGDGVAMSDLARRLGIPAPTLTKLVDRLVTDALVFRLADQADRRRVLVHASRRGDEIHRVLRSEVLRVESDFRRDITFTDRSMLQSWSGA